MNENEKRNSTAKLYPVILAMALSKADKTKISIAHNITYPIHNIKSHTVRVTITSDHLF